MKNSNFGMMQALRIREEDAKMIHGVATRYCNGNHSAAVRKIFEFAENHTAQLKEFCETIKPDIEIDDIWK